MVCEQDVQIRFNFMRFLKQIIKKNCGFYFVMHQSDVGVRAHANLLV